MNQTFKKQKKNYTALKKEHHLKDIVYLLVFIR
jgi:hypothetical protein